MLMPPGANAVGRVNAAEPISGRLIPVNRVAEKYKINNSIMKMTMA